MGSGQLSVNMYTHVCVCVCDRKSEKETDVRLSIIPFSIHPKGHLYPCPFWLCEHITHLFILIELGFCHLHPNDS